MTTIVGTAKTRMGAPPSRAVNEQTVLGTSGSLVRVLIEIAEAHTLREVVAAQTKLRALMGRPPSRAAEDAAKPDLPLRPEVAAFAQLMEQRLRAKDQDHVATWKHLDAKAHLVPLISKAMALDTSIACRRDELTRLHAVDVANYAMFVLDVMGLMEVGEGG